jgi:parallel beta-helix repeat protein
MNALTRFGTRFGTQPAMRLLPATTTGGGYPWADGDILYAADLNAAIATGIATGDDAVSIKDFGAKCDGVTDDSAAVNAAIAAVLAKPYGGNVLIPGGRTLLNSAIVATIPGGKTLTMKGAGATATELYFPLSTDGLNFTLGTASGAWGSIELTGFSIVRAPVTPVSANTGLRIAVVSGAIAKGVTILRDLIVRGSTGQTTRTNQWMKSVVLVGTNGAIVENVMIYAPDAAATDLGDISLSMSGGPAANQYAVSLNVLNCVILGGSTGIDISGWVQGVFISNSTVIGQFDSIRWIDDNTHFAEELAITDCSLNARHRGVHTDYVNQNAMNNSVVLHLAMTALDYLGIEFGHTYLSNIMGNNVVGLNSGGETGIALTDSATSVVIGNTVTNINGPGVYFKGTTATCLAVGNAIVGGAALSQDTPGNTFSANTFNGLAILAQNAVNDAAAAALNVPIGGEYRNGSIRMVRVA